MSTLSQKYEVKFNNGHIGMIYALVSGWAWCVHCNHWVRIHPQLEAEMRHEIQG